MRWEMRFVLAGLVALLLRDSPAATRSHVIAFGKPMSVQWFGGTGAGDEKTLFLKVRALVVDGRVKEYVMGSAHEITDRLFAGGAPSA